MMAMTSRMCSKMMDMTSRMCSKMVAMTSRMCKQDDMWCQTPKVFPKQGQDQFGLITLPLANNSTMIDNKIRKYRRATSEM